MNLADIIREHIFCPSNEIYDYEKLIFFSKLEILKYKKGIGNLFKFANKLSEVLLT